MLVHALIFDRNPDEDSPDNLFREAFQDCETGEIYEGEVAYGTYRHGKGIHPYTFDKYMS